MRKQQRKNYSQAFTLIETLVAIAILMISIAGPLAVANKALTASLYAKDQTTASFLAQEEMEIIKNIKDNNIAESNGIGWLAVPNTFTTIDVCTRDGFGCDISISSGSYTFQNPCSAISHLGCILYVNSNGYDHVNVNGTPTIFYRYFYLTPITSTEYQATIVVSWYEGSVLNAVTLSSELVDVAP